MITALKSWSNNSNICGIPALLLIFPWFFVMVNKFGLYPRHFEYYVLRLRLFFESYNRYDLNLIADFVFSSVQLLSRVRLFATPWTTACQASLSITNSWSLPKPMSIELVMPPNHLILCRPLLLLPSIFPSITVFSNESVLCIRWLKYWSFSFSLSPSNEHSGLISFRMDWLDLLAVPRDSQVFPTTTVQRHQLNSTILQLKNICAY